VQINEKLRDWIVIGKTDCLPMNNQHEQSNGAIGQKCPLLNPIPPTPGETTKDERNSAILGPFPSCPNESIDQVFDYNNLITI
jgi:hypothetical protein